MQVIRRAAAAAAAAVLVLLIISPSFAERLPGFDAGGYPGEQQREWQTRCGARILVNAAGDFDPARPTLLILYALPNGNTIEQTMGAKLEPAMDWHFDIQHVAAQVRKLRQVNGAENLVLACLEAGKKSWPAWRAAQPDNGTIIRSLVDEVSRSIATPNERVALASHSGGGSFIFGYLNGGDAIPDSIDRIVWLDADYAYSDEDNHGEKLLAWLKRDKKRHLIVFAYDDSQVTLNGKPVLKSPMGGTFGSTHRMIDRLSKDVKLVQSKNGEFDQWVGMNGQIVVRIHPNPEKKILHTVLVERNGLIEAMTLGTPWEGKWGGTFWGDRAYADLIAPAAATSRPATTRAAARPQATTLPARPANAPGGKAFAETIADLPPKAREAAIVQEIVRGNIPDFERAFHKLRVSDGDHWCVFEVMPDYLAVGGNGDFVRMPMTPASAKQIADSFACTLPTKKMVDDIYRQAEVKVEPRPLTERREAVRTFMQHNDIVEQQLKGKPLGALVAGHKKDVVITNRLREKPNKVAIYGWHKLDGKPIQPLYVGHADYYADYSHGIRLVKRACTVDGAPTTIDAVLRDPALCGLLSDEGTINAGC